MFDPSIPEMPTHMELVEVIKATEEDYEDYITFHVWTGPVGDIFYDVNSVYFNTLVSPSVAQGLNK